MNDVGLGELLVRMVVSLVVVLGLVLGAYVIIRRRQGMPSGRDLKVGRERSVRRTSLLGGRSGGAALRGAGKGGTKRGLRILGRLGVGRTSSVIAVQFADRVFMIGTSEQAPPTVLAELDLDAWNDATETPEDLQPIVRPGGGATPGAAGSGDRRPNILDALREATTRRG